MPMNNRLLRPLQTPGLLDLVPGAAAAYSLRSLSRSYADPVVTVRRSSDDAEDSFTASEVADGTLAAFCGAGDGFVKTWHSQAGTVDVTQSTTTRQPKIVDAGSVIASDGHPAIQFDGVDDFLAGGLSISTLGISIVALYKPVSTTGNERVFVIGDSTGDINSLYASASSTNGEHQFGYRLPANVPISGPSLTQEAMLALYFRNSTVLQKAYYFSVEYTRFAGTTTFTSTDIEIGRGNVDSVAFTGFIQELVFYPSDLTAQRELIEGNIAWSYSV